MARSPKTAGARLRAFREKNGVSLRETARQLHVVHPALMDWEAGLLVPSAPYRAAIEVWTDGAIKAAEWPLSTRERESTENAASVKPFRPAEPKGDPDPALPSTGTDSPFPEGES